MIAGMSVEYYTRLERGNLAGVSEQVLDSLARALQLGKAEREHLFDLARFLFLDPRAQEFFLDWDTVADGAVGALRGEAGRNPLDRSLTDLVGELATRSDEFRTRWSRHDVRLHRTAVKQLRNKLVGDIELTGDALEIPGEQAA